MNYSLIVEGMIEGTALRRIPRTKYISQIMQDAGITTYRELKDMTSDREKRRKHFVVNRKFVKNQSLD